MSKNILCKNKYNKVFLLETYATAEDVEKFCNEKCEDMRSFKKDEPVYWITDADVMAEYELPYDEMGYIVFTEDSFSMSK